MTLYHPAKEAELKYLRRMVDVLEPEAYKTDATQDAKNLSLIHISEPTRPY